MSDEIKYEDAVKELFEKGTKLAAICSDKLKKAEQKITMLTKENNND